MRENFYSVYLDSIYALAATTVIKCEDAAVAINNGVTQLGVAVSADPTTWRYYLNICGLYHSTNSNITITSLDTLEQIAFTVENLQVHTNTALAYQYGTRYYNDLVSLYPDDQLLILGVLYPADMQKAIHSPDGTILSYPSYLVEEQEYS